GDVEGTRTPEGTIFYGTWKQIREAFPHAELVDATPLLTEVRYVKSQEELDALSKSMEIIELAFEAEIEAARPGVKDWRFGQQISTPSCATAPRCPCTSTGCLEKIHGARSLVPACAR